MPPVDETELPENVIPTLKLESQTELHLPAEARTCDTPELAGADFKRWRIERWCIGEVVVLPAELNFMTLADVEVLEDGKVQTGEARSRQYIASAIAIVAACENERRCVEPALQASLA